MMATKQKMSPTLIPMKRPLETDPETDAAYSTDTKDGTATLNIHVQPPTSPTSLNDEHEKPQPVLPTGSSRQPSPALSSISSLTSISSMLSPCGLDGTIQSKEASSTAGSSNKRRKLTPAEKQQRQEEKDRKEKERAEKKAEREEQKQVKDEERRQKNEIKEAKRREKELEKERKDQEKQRIEEEKERKERAQKRIVSFFAKPPVASGLSNQDEPLDTSSSSADNTIGAKAESDLKESEAPKNDYRRTFFAFALPSNTSMAPINRFSWDDDAQLHIEETLEQSLRSNTEVSLTRSLDLQTPSSKSRGTGHRAVRDIIRSLSIADSENHRDSSMTGKTSLEQLQSIPMRYIYFTQDVRPPYVGTYSKLTSKQLSKARRNPFAKLRPDTDYNYDSECEWEEPEEGEELLSEGESELDSNDETDEMDDFLDDQDGDGQQQKRKVISSDLEPVCSGLCFETSKGVSLDADGQRSDLRRYKMGLFQDSIRLPIDPFCSTYWPASENEGKKTKAASSSNPQTSRQPLQARPSFFTNMQTQKTAPTNDKTSKQENKVKATPGRLLDGQELADFKAAVAGSEHAKAGLLSILKKQFPKVPNKVLQDTLDAVAERKGRSWAEKRWILKETG